MGRSWQKLSVSIRRSLNEISLAQLAGTRQQTFTHAHRTRAQVHGARRQGVLMSSDPRVVPKDAGNHIDALMGKSYRHGFVTDIDSDTLPPGLDEDVVRLISRKKKEPRVPDGLAPQGLPPLADHERAALGAPAHPPDRLPGRSPTIRRPSRTRTRPRAWTRSIRSCSRPTTSSAVPLHERARLAGVAVDAVFDCVSVATTFKERLAEGRRDLLLVLRGGAEASGADREVSGHRRAVGVTTTSRR